MPAPSIIVTFKDAEGDEFPVRIWGTQEDFDRPTLIEEGMRKVLDLTDKDAWSPMFPLDTEVEVEDLNQ